ncbi:MAG TPA: ATP synthase F1 subunit delta [Nitrospirota bacterium]|nr:ATP synthase F1 subunit delta [Nitrospirota bacterium]
MIRTIAKRYAKALMALAEEKKIIEKTKDDLTAFIGAIDMLPAMQKLFASPVFTPENKKLVIKELASRLKLQKTTERFLEYLADSGRIRYVKDVYEAFLAILAEHQNRATVQLSTAVSINDTDLANIKKKLELLTGKVVEIKVQVDETLIGGAKAQIGSVIYDGTIKNQVDKMRHRLMN